jgi:AmiR/NasT family two-component response regulator
MGAQHCDADEAHRLLVAAAQRENLEVRLIAQRIVDRATNGDAT